MTTQTGEQMMTHLSPIIGYHRAPLSQKFGAPRQPNLVGVISAIEMSAPFDTPAAFVGLEAFSHLWLSWSFHHNQHFYAEQSHQASDQAKPSFRAQVRPPRLGGNQKIGVFASRSMYRPSQLGLSVVKLESIEIVDGRVILMISGADLIDGTPIIDIKPYVAYSDSIDKANSGFAPIAPVALEVTITDNAHAQFLSLVTRTDSANNSTTKNNQTLNAKVLMDKIQQQVRAEDMGLIQALIAQDPRPAYRRDELNATFTMRYKSVDVSFCQVEQGQLQIIAVVAVILN